ncbi:N-acetylmuramoyl-L-alanine amidase [Lewinella sp. 4G2]|uniref:N-acetylmuramoyl-L-alanine amidase family protein n=1 Tax=Lewinella sp. 4G2 TaxID=1803372 RepID=UPI0012FB249D|nr:N-acetylmuramoyl-L-alanine amidase [Lewinella sp. 4G2]
MKGLFSLFILLICLVPTTVMTAATWDSSPGATDFNGTLITGLKSTLRASNDIRLVVIDPGHGGKDPGGLGKHCQEKDIALNVAILLRDELELVYPTIEFVLTREDDRFIPLVERAALANNEGADLFISIHANIARNREAFGTETFVMGDHVLDYNLEVAARENGVVEEYEGKRDARYDVDPYTNAGHILLSHDQNENLNRSITFAGLVENEFAGSGRKSRGVKQAGFMVLKRTTMPAVLVELGFMSNDQEEAYLMSSTGQKSLANSLTRAFISYREMITGKKYDLAEARQTPIEATPTNGNGWKAANVSPTALTYTPSDKVSTTTTSANAQPTSSTPIAVAMESDAVSIRVQLAKTTKPADYRALGWDKLGHTVTETQEGKYYVYQIHGLKDGPSARALVQELKATGTDCFVVAYAGDEKLTGPSFTAVLSK